MALNWAGRLPHPAKKQLARRIADAIEEKLDDENTNPQWRQRRNNPVHKGIAQLGPDAWARDGVEEDGFI